MKNIFRSVTIILVVLLSVSGSVFAYTNDTVVRDDEYEHKLIVEALKQGMQEAVINAESQAKMLEFEQLSRQMNMQNIGPTSAFDKFWYRVQFSTASTLISPFLPMTSTFLSHSLQDNPSNLTYEAGSSYSNKVKSSSPMSEYINTIRNRLPSTGQYWSELTSLTLDDPNDLYLSLNKVGIIAGAEKTGSVWIIYILVNDTYDFEHTNFTAGNGIPSAAVTIINNHAADAQDAGAIVPYSINIYLQD